MTVSTSQSPPDAGPVQGERALPDAQAAPSEPTPVRGGRFPTWAGPACRLGVGALAALAVTAGAGILLVMPDGSGFLQPADNAAARWLAAHPVGVVTAASRVASLVGGPLGATVLAFAATAVLARRARTRSRAAAAVAPLLTLGVVQLVVQLAKVVVARPRPTGAAMVVASGHAFPSGHAATAAALATCFLLVEARTSPDHRWSPPLAFAAVTTAAGIALSRLVLGVHWLSDVAVGGLLGVAVGLLVVRALLPRRRCRAPRHRRRLPSGTRWAGAAFVVPALAVSSVSYTHALTSPGHASVDARTVDWLRNNGMSAGVDRAESWWLWKHTPSPTATISSMPPAPPAAAPLTPANSSAQNAVPAVALAADGHRIGDAPVTMTPFLSPPLTGEGTWTPVLVDRNGIAQVAIASLRADPLHPSVVASLAWMNQSAVRFQLIAGTRQPFGSAGPAGAQIPAELQPQVLAAFNSGYKMKDTPGGALIEGRSYRALARGIAALAIRPDGSIAVGEWGRDITGASDFVAVRQNLHLIIDNGQLVDGLAHNVGGRWGTVKNALPTWRSGIGVDAAGNLVYASGNNLTLDTLAAALQRAGARTAMELDIHNHMVTYNYFTHLGGPPLPTGHKLSADMTESASRYLAPDQRDFVAVYPR